MSARQTRQLVQYALTFVAVLGGLWLFLDLVAYFFEDTLSHSIRIWNRGAGFFVLVAIAASVTYIRNRYAHRLGLDKDPGFPPVSYDFTSRQHSFHRQNLIAQVRASYIEGILYRSMPQQVRLNLRIQELPDVLLRREARWEGQSLPQLISTSDDIYRLFVEGGRALLILGAPASGKTITMLELCDRLLQDATPDSLDPIPIVVELSSWVKYQKPLVGWLVDEVFRQYGFPRTVTPAWLENNQFCLLLDGLDEVSEDLRDDCVLAINDFRAAHTASMVVCSRIADYGVLSQKLNLSRALFIQPLEPDQRTAYLTNPKLHLQAVYDAVQQDKALAELATTPLILNVMAVAYEGISPAELEPLLQDETTWRGDLYDHYISRVFQRRPLPENGYSATQALYWLNLLAYRMTERGQLQFFIEDLQFDWLSPTLRYGFSGLVGFLGGVLFGVFLGANAYAEDESLIHVLAYAMAGFLLGFLIGAVISNSIGFSRAPEPIEPVDRLRIADLRAAARTIPRELGIFLRATLFALPRMALYMALAIGLVGALEGGLEGAVGALEDYFVVTMSGVLLCFWAFGLFAGLAGLLRASVDSQSRSYPAQGIRRSAINALSAGILLGFLGGVLVSVLLVALGSDLGTSLSLGLLAGLFSALVSGLIFGGDTVIRHYALRAALARFNHLPFRLVPFMEGMKDRILVQRTSASFRFIHRSFQEHIAALTIEDIERITAVENRL